MESRKKTEGFNSVKWRNIELDSLTEVESYLNTHKLIVLDVFSTLFLVNLLSSKDLYDYDRAFVSSLLQDNKFNHRSYRIEAEKRVTSVAAGKNFTLDDIYDEYQKITCLSADVVGRIKTKEIKSKLAFIKLRRSGARLFHYAKKRNKTLVLLASYLFGGN